jgi:hypothetical protein
MKNAGRNQLPSIPIATGSFRRALFLDATMRSMLNQGYAGLEYIVIDGSTQDGSVDVIQRHASRLAYWVSEPDVDFVYGGSIFWRKRLYDRVGGLEPAGTSLWTLTYGSVLPATPRPSTCRSTCRARAITLSKRRAHCVLQAGRKTTCYGNVKPRHSPSGPNGCFTHFQRLVPDDPSIHSFITSQSDKLSP